MTQYSGSSCPIRALVAIRAARYKRLDAEYDAAEAAARALFKEHDRNSCDYSDELLAFFDTQPYLHQASKAFRASENFLDTLQGNFMSRTPTDPTDLAEMLEVLAVDNGWIRDDRPVFVEEFAAALCSLVKNSPVDSDYTVCPEAADESADWPEFQPWLEWVRKAEAKFLWLSENSGLSFEDAEPHEKEASSYMRAANDLAEIMERRDIRNERQAAMRVAIAVQTAERGINDMFAAWSAI